MRNQNSCWSSIVSPTPDIDYRCELEKRNFQLPQIIRTWPWHFVYFELSAFLPVYCYQKKKKSYCFSLLPEKKHWEYERERICMENLMEMWKILIYPEWKTFFSRRFHCKEYRASSDNEWVSLPWVKKLKLCNQKLLTQRLWKKRKWKSIKCTKNYFTKLVKMPKMNI